MSERPLKKGLFLRIGKYFFNIISPVRNQTYKLYVSYYNFNRSKRQKYYILIQIAALILFIIATSLSFYRYST